MPRLPDRSTRTTALAAACRRTGLPEAAGLSAREAREGREIQQRSSILSNRVLKYAYIRVGQASTGFFNLATCRSVVWLLGRVVVDDAAPHR